jgi:gamma-glutamylcyclotransferase (GGCT)/AIG2-like uncharacterized protein YtfP
MEEKSNYLFVYGTLLEGKNKFGAYLKNNSQFYQKGKFNGKLYDIGEYPGAISDPKCDAWIHGSIFIMHEPAGMLKVLDDYEGFGEAYPQPNEFIRELLDVETDDKAVKCWVYLYNWPVDNLKLIISGDYFSSKPNSG